MLVICIGCACFVTSYSIFQTNVLAKFVDIIGIFLYTHSPCIMCHCTEYKLLALQIRISEVNKLNAMTQQFITAKISGCVLKQGSKPLLITAPEQFTTTEWGCCNVLSDTSSRAQKVCGLAGAHPGLQDRILLNYTRIDNVHKVHMKTFNFSYV